MSKLDKDAVLEQFTQAYTKVNGKPPEIEAKGGWYSIDGGKNIRLSAVEELTADLLAGDSNQSTETVAVSEAKVEKPKKVTKKASTKKASKKATAFSVKDFYANEILAHKPGSKAPR